MALAVNSALIERGFQPRAEQSAFRARQFEVALAQSTEPRTTAAQRTQMSVTTASAELRNAWTRVTGDTPNDKTVALLTAQWAHETAHGASMYNYNFGGIKGVGPSGLSVAQRTREGYGTSERQIIDRFRAYDTAEAGADDYVKLLTRRYPEAVDAARAGDAEGFVRGLKQRGYFTGDERAYQRSVTNISESLLATSFQGQSPSGSAELTSTRAASSRHQVVPEVQTGESALALSRVLTQRALSSLVRPLTPTVLMSALSENPVQDRELLSMADTVPLAHVSTSSLIDEVLRASLQVAAPRDDATRQSGGRG